MPRALPVAEGAETLSMALPVSPQLARPVTRSLLFAGVLADLLLLPTSSFSSQLSWLFSS
jgi:hypothetical protein